MKVFGTLAFISIMDLVAQAYRIQYHDCGKPNKIIQYSKRNVCKQQMQSMNVAQTYTLLQQQKQPKLIGYSCSVRKSTFVLYCGAFSHTKIAQPPDIELNIKIGLRECDSIVATGKFKSLEGGRQPVKLN